MRLTSIPILILILLGPLAATGDDSGLDVLDALIPASREGGDLACPDAELEEAVEEVRAEPPAQTHDEPEPRSRPPRYRVDLEMEL